MAVKESKIPVAKTGSVSNSNKNQSKKKKNNQNTLATNKSANYSNCVKATEELNTKNSAPKVNYNPANKNQITLKTAKNQINSKPIISKNKINKSEVISHKLEPDYYKSECIEKNDGWVSPVQSVFLWFMSSIYLFIFISIYYQIRGLYGNNGVTPLRYFAARFVSSNESSNDLTDLITNSPSWVWSVAHHFGLSLTSSFEVITLVGIALSFLQLILDSFRNFVVYFVLFCLYQSIVNVGQVFFYFQWDSLVLEVGVLTILLAIRNRAGSLSFTNRFSPHPLLGLWAIRWLLFRFMLSSGIVKFTARDPLWWSLQALDVHFESQPLPTSIAWYAHHLPKNWLHVSVVGSLVVEIVGPFLFFTPFRSLKIFSFASQVILQLSILSTGNYNFFNLLTIVMCLTLLDDDIISKRKNDSTYWPWFELFFTGVVFGFISYYTVYYFNISLSKGSSFFSNLLIGPDSKINFTYDQLNLFVSNAITISIILGVISFICVTFIALYKACSYGTLLGRCFHFVSTLLYASLLGLIFALSIVPLAELDSSGNHLKSIHPIIRRWHQVAHDLNIVSSYGLFRSMTGAEGRPELIIEGSNTNPTDVSAENWHQYHFLYKPGDLYDSPKFIIPHQPRLDWQMWFAALGSYQDNPWLIHLCYRLFTGEPGVLDLLDRSRLPFKSPPKYLRISRYYYRYTDSSNEKAWWKKVTNRHAYLPVVTKETIQSALKLDEKKLPKVIENLTVDRKWIYLVNFLDSIYSFLVIRLARILPPYFISWALFLFALIIQLKK